jgi:hypothetical protein
MVRELLEDAVRKFNEKSREDPKFREDIVDKERTIVFNLDDGRSWNFKLEGGEIDGVHDGGLEEADISISSDEETIRGIFNGDISPMRAYALKKIKFKASLQDLLTLRKLF